MIERDLNIVEPSAGCREGQRPHDARLIVVNGRCRADVEAIGGLVENLPQPLERWVSLDPAKAVLVRPKEGRHAVGVRSMDAWARPAKPPHRFPVLFVALAKPEFTFALAAGEQDVAESRNLIAQGGPSALFKETG